MSNALNKIKDGYLAAVDWVELNPNKTLWAAVVVIALAVRF